MNTFANKKILVLAPNYYGYERVILNELEQLGAMVSYLENKAFVHDPDYKGTSWYLKILCEKERYIKRILLPAAEKQYDIFFVVDLFSFHPDLIKNLKAKNPKIRCILYLWDNIEGYHWKQFFHHFDIVYTFDPVEATRYNLLYWPNFYPRYIRAIESPQYDICSIGSLQIHRLFLLEDAVIQPTAKDKKMFLYLYVPPLETKIVYNVLVFTITRLFGKRFHGYQKRYKLYYNQIDHSLVKHEPLSLNDAVDHISKSKCILDLPYPTQTGSTQRVINALGLNKKVITTNQSVKEEMFYNEEFIKITSISNFSIDWDWINKEPTSNIDVSYLQIDNWLKKLLS